MVFGKNSPIVAAPRGAVLKGEAEELWKKYFTAAPKKGCGKKKGMSDADYMKRVHAKLEKFNPKARGLEKFGLEPEEVSEIAPIDIYGFNWVDAAVSPSYLCSSRYEVTWIYFSDKQLYAYTLEIDMLSDSYYETLREYFYSDVTSVVTLDEANEREIWLKGCLKPKKSYDFVNKCHVQICVPGAPDFKLHVYTNDNPEFAAKIRSLKLKLREKKA